MKRLLAITLAVVLTLCLSIGSFSAQLATANSGDIHVPGDYNSIKNAIEAASSGKTIYVAAGNYTENIEMKSGVIIQGAGANVTFIDGGGSGTVVDAYNVDSAAKLDGFTITNGNADRGGGIWIHFYSSPTISNCLIEENTANKDGAGMWIHSTSSPRIENCLIRNNQATDAGSRGGGIFVTASSSPKFINCTIIDNSASDGGGIYHLASSSTITNTIIYGNTANNIPSGDPSTITYSCIEGGWSGDGNIGDDPDDDPLFVGSGDYHLQSGSPCIDTGTDTDAPSHDIDGVPRPQGTDVDMGAYEAVEEIITYTTINATAGSGGSINPSGNVTVTSGDNQTFAITPDTGFHIADVNVGSVSQGATDNYTFTNVTDNHTIHASFTQDQYTLDVNFIGSGNVTLNPDQPTYTYDTVVTLNATAAEGWSFAGWSGNLTGTTNPDTITMTGNMTVTATFTEETVQDAYSIKLTTITVLESGKTGDKKIDKKIDKIIKHIQKSLEDKLWIDTSHLSSKGGKKVFSEEKKAVKELMKIKDNPTVSHAITLLLEADRGLAQIAIDDAEGGDAKKIAKAQREMAKAQKEIDKGKYDKAIDHYKKAWKHTQKAMK